MKKLFTTILTGALISAPLATFAQELKSDSTSSKLEKLDEKVNLLSKKLEESSRLKISGYVQFQWQMAQGKGAPTEYNGGSFPANSDNRFQIRRGRVKFDYTYNIVKAVLQIDATEKGVKLKDAYVGVATKSKVFGLTAGVFDRPFGYEISYSSSRRETPERSRVYQVLFPDERDLGAKITLQGREKTFMNSFKFEGGLFAGNGTNVETNSAKDFIGHLTFNRVYKKVEFGLGASLYAGNVLNETETSFSFDKATASYVQNENALNKYYQRLYWGVDGQLTLKTGAGKTNIRAEYLEGKQPGTAKSSNSPKGSLTSEIYNRQFRGYSIYVVQDICKSPFGVAARFDSYDPNRHIKADQIGLAGTSTGAADISFKTLGISGLWTISKMFRVMANYEFVWNEKCPNLVSEDSYKDFSKNIKDNVFTLRLQMKF